MAPPRTVAEGAGAVQNSYPHRALTPREDNRFFPCIFLDSRTSASHTCACRSAWEMLAHVGPEVGILPVHLGDDACGAQRRRAAARRR
jgi:hypothetical protein